MPPVVTNGSEGARVTPGTDVVVVVEVVVVVVVGATVVVVVVELDVVVVDVVGSASPSEQETASNATTVKQTIDRVRIRGAYTSPPGHRWTVVLLSRRSAASRCRTRCRAGPPSPSTRESRAPL